MSEIFVSPAGDKHGDGTTRHPSGRSEGGAMVDKQESMTVEEFLRRSQEVVVVGRLEATEDESRVKLTLVSSSGSSCCQKAMTLSKQAIKEVRAVASSGSSAQVVEVVLNDKATFTASEIFGEHGVAACRCGEDTATARMAVSGTTTVDRCRACGCLYDGLSCRCGSPRTADCARGLRADWPYVIAVRSTE